MYLEAEIRQRPATANTAYRSTGGFYRNLNSHCYTCRDEFAGCGILPTFFMSCCNMEFVSRILRETETILNAEPYSKVYPCQKHTAATATLVVQIEVSLFWQEHRLRYSFLTALLKSAGKKSDTDYTACKLIRETRYFKASKRATFDFLMGRSYPNIALTSSGWQEVYTNGKSGYFGYRNNPGLLYYPPDPKPTQLSEKEQKKMKEWATNCNKK